LAGVEGFEPPNGGIKTRSGGSAISNLLILLAAGSPPFPSIPRRSHGESDRRLLENRPQWYTISYRQSRPRPIGHPPPPRARNDATFDRRKGAATHGRQGQVEGDIAARCVGDPPVALPLSGAQNRSRLLNAGLSLSNWLWAKHRPDQPPLAPGRPISTIVR